jgi:hypothetical protein
MVTTPRTCSKDWIVSSFSPSASACDIASSARDIASVLRVELSLSSDTNPAAPTAPA